MFSASPVEIGLLQELSVSFKIQVISLARKEDATISSHRSSNGCFSAEIIMQYIKRTVERYNTSNIHYGSVFSVLSLLSCVLIVYYGALLLDIIM